MRRLFGLLLAPLVTACATVPSGSIDLRDALMSMGIAGPYRQVLVDLNDDGRDEAIVHLEGRDFCGSGGCTSLVLTSEEGGWRLVSRTTVTRLPFRVLDARSHGWSDLAVAVGGGGLTPQEARLRSDGAAYPSNPTAPLDPVASGTPGRTVLDDGAPILSVGD